MGPKKWILNPKRSIFGSHEVDFILEYSLLLGIEVLSGAVIKEVLGIEVLSRAVIKEILRIEVVSRAVLLLLGI